VEVFDLVELVFGKCGAAKAFQFFFVVAEFIAVIAKGLPPLGAFGGVLRDVCLNHGRSILRLRNQISSIFRGCGFEVAKYKALRMEMKIVYLPVSLYILAYCNA
jgi:uncharacterized membrane protein YeiH